MDADRLDALARSLAAVGSRRRALAAVLSGVLSLPSLARPDDAAAAKKNKRRKGRKKKCKGSKKRCGGKCVNTCNDPRNCGSCGKRCQLNAICSAGTCTCVNGACPNSEATCCPAASPRGACRCSSNLDPTTCEVFGADCPPGTTRCAGAICSACCPAGSTCDTSTGTCLQ
jgi:hypothetical protein